MPAKPPAITGPQLIELLRRDGWIEDGHRTHGMALIRRDSQGNFRSTIIPTKNRPLPAGTLGAILGPKQTGLGKRGLAALIKKYGLP